MAAPPFFVIKTPANIKISRAKGNITKAGAVIL